MDTLDGWMIKKEPKRRGWRNTTLWSVCFLLNSFTVMADPLPFQIAGSLMIAVSTLGIVYELNKITIKI